MSLSDKLLGVLYGCAAGDALGYEIEFMSWDSILEHYGEDGIRTYKLHGGKAPVSDDTQMLLFTAAGMVLGAEKGIEPDVSIFRAYQDWYKTQDGDAEDGWEEENWLLSDNALFKRQAPGNTTLTALEGHVMGSLTHRLNHSKGCGGAMRTAICGFVDAKSMPDFPPEHAAAILGAQAAAITHSHDMGWLPAAMVSDIIYRIVYLNTPVAEAVETSLDLMKRLFPKAEGLAEFEDLITRAIEWGTAGDLPGEPWDQESINELGGGWVGDEAVAIAVYCACKYPEDFDACIRAAVNHSGDSDSTGAIAGAILGAALGASAIDTSWKDAIDVKDAIQATAERLERVARPL